MPEAIPIKYGLLSIAGGRELSFTFIVNAYMSAIAGVP